MTQNELKAGEEFLFENDTDFMTVEYSDHLNCFLIWFNGKIIKDPKTFKTLEKQVQELKQKHNLK